MVRILDILARVLKRPREGFMLRFLQFGEPDIKTALEEIIANGVKKL
ncbi:MAG: hypothetical protein ACPLSJ_02790 [Thermosulfidibacteraceae bacterium]